VKGIPYLGRPDLSYAELHRRDEQTRERLAILQARFTGAPVIGASWFSYDDQELDFNSIESRLQWLVPEVEPIVRAHVDVEAQKLADALGALAKIPGNYAKKITRSADRFALSQCRYRHVDRAIDLAIAFELLAGSRGDGAIGWKVSLRAAQFIGGTTDQRRQMRDKINALYKLRNEGSHGGTPGHAEVAQQGEDLVECSQIYRQLVETILQFGDEPDWQKYELDARVQE
jgi:hypothetical protein